MVAIVVAIALAVLAGRAAADPLDDEQHDDEIVEAVDRPEVVDAPTIEDAEQALDDLGLDGLGGIAGSEDWVETQQRHHRPSRFGRLDLQLSYLHRDSDPAIAAPHVFDEVLLALVWRN